MNFIRTEWKFLVSFLLVLGVIGLIYHEYSQLKTQLLFRPNQPPAQGIAVNTSGQDASPGEVKVVYVQGQNTHTQEIVYVPKAVDPQTGALEKTAVELNKSGNEVSVKVNGKEFQIPADVQETAKFDKGKLVITEQSKMDIAITAPKPSFNLGIGWSGQGPAVAANGPVYKNVSWWAYKDRNRLAGGLMFPIAK